MMPFQQFESDFKPAPIPGDMMGHVKDTENVRVAEKKYGRPLVGYSAKWLILPTSVRVQVWDNNQWCGVFPLTADDVKYYTEE